MVKRTTTISLILCLMALAITAKRTAAPIIPPITHDGIIYKAPNDDGRVAYVDAYDLETGKKIWHKVIFRNYIWSHLEEDVQWVFIADMKVENRRLIVTSEEGKRYSIKLAQRLNIKRPA